MDDPRGILSLSPISGSNGKREKWETEKQREIKRREISGEYRGKRDM